MVAHTQRNLEQAEQIFDLRTELGWSQTELARRAGVDVKTINRLEGGRTTPNLITLRKIARALGVPVRDLINQPEEKNGTWID